MLIDYLVFNAFQHHFTSVTAAKASIHSFLSSLNQYSAQYSFEATGCFPTYHCQTMDSGERGMNPIAMTIINPP